MTSDPKGSNTRVRGKQASCEAAWIKAQDAFAWLAFGDDQSFAAFYQALTDNPIPPSDPVLSRKLNALASARDHVVMMAQADSVTAFVQSPTSADMKPVPSIVFAQGLTINIFHGNIGRTEEAVQADDETADVARRAYARLKLAGFTEQVWFHRVEILDLVRSPDEAPRPGADITTSEAMEVTPANLDTPSQLQGHQSRSVSSVDNGRIALSAVRWPAPTSALMTACEVLTWIAFGAPVPKERLGEGVDFGRWGTDRLDDLLVALDARASPEPFSPLEPAFRKPRFMDFYIGKNWAASCRILRAHARKHDLSLVSFSDLRDQLRDDLNRQRNGDVLIEMAGADLVERLREGKIIAIGRLNGASPDEIPTRIFWDRHVTVMWWDTIEPEYHGPRFQEVQFRTSDVLRIWPPVRKSTDERESPEHEPREHQALPPHQVYSGGLKERWRDRITLTHAVARIAYGDVIESRYNIRNGLFVSGSDARRWRGSEKPSTSGLPGTEGLLGLSKQSFEKALDAWLVDDDRKWQAAEGKLRDALRSRALVSRIGEGHEIRRVSEDFWSQYGPMSRDADECFLLASEFEYWLQAGDNESAAHRNLDADEPPCPVEAGDFKETKARDDALRAWARWRYLERGVPLPGRKELIKEHRAKFGAITGINERTMGSVVRPLAPQTQRKGGAPTHRSAREN